MITSKSKLRSESKYSFSDYRNISKYYHIPFKSKYIKSLSFYYRLNEFRNLVSRTEKTKTKKKSNK